MTENRFHQLNIILLWILLFVNVLGKEKLLTRDIQETSKALKITNTETVGVLHSDQKIILNYNHSIFESTSNNLVTLKHLTWINEHVEAGDLGLLKKLPDLESLAFIHTEGSIILTKDILKNLTELKELVIHHNDHVILEEGSLENLINLQVLSADNQSLKLISSETFKNCEKLQYLSLTSGFLGSIQSKTFQRLKDLISITLTRMSLKYLKKNTFSNLPFLYVINLSGNELFQVSGEEFSNLPRLEILNLEKNFLHSLNAENLINNLPHLNILNISENKFSCVEKFRLNDILLKRNISSFEKRDLNRCRLPTNIVQIFSA